MEVFENKNEQMHEFSKVILMKRDDRAQSAVSRGGGLELPGHLKP